MRMLILFIDSSATKRYVNFYMMKNCLRLEMKLQNLLNRTFYNDGMPIDTNIITGDTDFYLEAISKYTINGQEIVDYSQNSLHENLTQLETKSLYSDLNQDKLNKVAQKLGLEVPEKNKQ